MTQSRFEMILSLMAMTGGAAAWIAAWNLCGPVGRRRLAFGLNLNAIAADVASWGRAGAHASRRSGDVPTYEGERLHLINRRSENQRAADYAAMIQDIDEALPVSSAPLVEFTAELRRLTDSDAAPIAPTALAALHEVVKLQGELAEVERSYRYRIDAAVRAALGGDPELALM